MKIIIIIILLAFIILALSFLLTFIMYRMQFGKRIDICEADKKSDIPRRKKIEFYSGKNKLTGYFYGINQNKVNNKVVLVVNGYGVTYNAYMPEICELINCGYSLRKDVINNQAEFLLEKNRGHYPTRIENEKDIVINKEIFEVIKEYIKDT